VVVMMMVVLMYRWQSGGDGGADVQVTKWW
jgi:hypothetical protein